jgi:hypothetical protein
MKYLVLAYWIAVEIVAIVLSRQIVAINTNPVPPGVNVEGAPGLYTLKTHLEVYYFALIFFLGGLILWLPLRHVLKHSKKNSA